MPEPDFEAARRYALGRLARELSPALRYHSLAHTRDDVTAAAARLAVLEGLASPERLLLLTAAYYHDIGYVVQRTDHESAGVRIIQQALPGFGYSAAQVEAVAALVLATRLPHAPRTLAEEILSDADLDVLGREDYWARNADLRAEWEAFGEHLTDHEWHRSQLAFLSGHRYFTASARQLREAQKQANIARLMVLLNGTQPLAT